MTRKVFSIVGARPQFIKAAILTRAIRDEPSLEEAIVHSGQHFDANMSEVFFRELQIPEPTYYLGIHAGTHGAMTGRMLESLEALLLAQRPDLVVVFGDTNTTLAAALAAAKLRIPVAHVEAGMRAYQPIPEEINRVLTDHVSDLLFTVNSRSTDALQKESISGPRVKEVGDVMFDCTLAWSALAEQRSTILERCELQRKRYVLCTAHRAGTTDDEARMAVLLTGLKRVAGEMPIVFPVHPRTRKVLERLGLVADLPRNMSLIDPVGYLDMLQLERAAALIVTDSGGVQREAFFHQVPCVTFRDETEWPELVESGWNTLLPLDNPRNFADVVLGRVGSRGGPLTAFGDGKASFRIARALAEF